MDEEKETPEQIEENKRVNAIYQAQDWARGRNEVTSEELISVAKRFYSYIKTGE